MYEKIDGKNSIRRKWVEYIVVDVTDDIHISL